tara:strand:+ start:1122 stop:1940 length:819 start_codon:yes stop_codon:yes gene_type:complete
MNSNEQILPVYFHIPKNAGTYIHKTFYNRLTMDGIAKHFINVFKDGENICNIICGDVSKYNNFKQTAGSWLYAVELKDLQLENIGVKLISITPVGFRNYKKEIYNLIPNNISIREFICLRSPYNRLQSLYSYNYSQSNNYKHKTSLVSSHLTFIEYINSNLLEECWLIRNILDIPDSTLLTEDHYNKACNILDTFDLMDFNNISNDASQFYNMYYKPYIKSEVSESTFKCKSNVTSGKIDIDFNMLDIKTQNKFNERQKWDIKLFNRYIKTK